MEIEQKLKELKSLYEKGLITKDVYEEQQRTVLSMENMPQARQEQHATIPVPIAPEVVKKTTSLLQKLFIFNIPTVFVMLFGWWVDPRNGFDWPILLGIPALVLISICAIISYFGQRHAQHRPSLHYLDPSFRKLLRHYELIPWLISQFFIIPATIFCVGFSSEFTPSSYSPWNYPLTYLMFSLIYAGLVGIPLFVVAVWVYRHQKKYQKI